LGVLAGRRSLGGKIVRPSAGRVRQKHRRGAREGGRRLRHRCLPRRAAGLAHLVWLDRRARRRRGAHAVARLGFRREQGGAAGGGGRGGGVPGLELGGAENAVGSPPPLRGGGGGGVPLPRGGGGGGGGASSRESCRIPPP